MCSCPAQDVKRKDWSGLNLPGAAGDEAARSAGGAAGDAVQRAGTQASGTAQQAGAQAGRAAQQAGAQAGSAAQQAGSKAGSQVCIRFSRSHVTGSCPTAFCCSADFSRQVFTKVLLASLGSKSSFGL